MKLESILFLIYLILSVSCFELTVNDEDIEDPVHVLKSKFKPYLPELKDHIEIPIKDTQNTIRESYIPNKIKMKSLRSKFKQELPTSVTKFRNKINLETVKKESNDKSSQDSPVNSKIDSKMMKTKRSWIKDFLKFKDNKKDNKELHSSIKNYDDTLNNPDDLKKWTKLIVDEDIKENNNIIRSKSFINQNEIEIDIEEFINYLVNEQGFNPQDLEFLKIKDLDYGLNEIENELNKLGDPHLIDIGGEDLKNHASNLNLNCSYFGLIIFLLFLN
ncbi:unnamed protein product [Candida verbasci]|uniref:Uncharacterized protein n=1 Tax=Candida verbasci TaxID=1227364 RepID=A0A9W4XDA0_9ASCO|nr:unnamed protein product [Candida verbasci]